MSLKNCRTRFYFKGSTNSALRKRCDPITLTLTGTLTLTSGAKALTSEAKALTSGAKALTSGAKALTSEAKALTSGQRP